MVGCLQSTAVATSALSWHSAFGEQYVWIDLAVFAVLAGIHTVANWLSPGLPNTPVDRTQAATNVNQIATGGVTAVGILLPLSLAAIVTFAAKKAPANGVLVNTFVAEAWFALSLILGLCVLWAGAFRAASQNVQNLRFVRIFAGYQLFCLMLGVIRFLIAAFILIQHPS